MTNNISKKSLFWFLGYIVIFAAVIIFLLNPTLSEITKNKKMIKSEQKQLAANYDQLSSLQKIAKDKEGFGNIKDTVLGYLPATLNSSQFIVEVEGLAKKTDITIDSFSMSASPSSVSTAKTTGQVSNDVGKTDTTKKKAKTNTQQNEFSLSTKADFTKTMSFIAQMEKLSRFNSISSISIASAENGGADVKITGNIFYEQ